MPPPEVPDELVLLVGAEGAVYTAPPVDALVAALTLVRLGAGTKILATRPAHKPFLTSMPCKKK